MKKALFFLICFITANSLSYAQLNTGLAAYWKLDGSAADATGVNNGTLNGSPSSVTGKIGTAYSFISTVSNYISFANSTSLNIQTNTISLSAWVKPTSNGVQMVVNKISGVGTHVSPYFQYNLQLYYGTTLYPRFYLSIGGTPYSAASSSASMTLNQWYHLVGTYDGTTMRLYLNGSQVATTAVTGNITAYTTPVYIGANGALGEIFSGSIDEVGIWNRTLSVSEITQLYNSGNGLAYPFTTTPAAPSGLTATAASCSQVNLSWTDNSNNETGFYIYRGGSQIASVGAGVNSYSNTGLTASTAYSYYVIAYNGSGNSANSNTASVTTPSCSSIPVTSITITPSPLTIAPGGAVQLTATVLPANATDKIITWTAMCDITKLTVSSTGLVTALGAVGYTGTIGAVANSNGVQGAVSVNIQAIPVTGVTLNKTSETITIGSTLQLVPTVAPFNANRSVTWSSSNTSVATVNSTGLVTPVAVGNATITVTTVNDAKTATCAVTVVPPPSATWYSNGNNAYYSLGKVGIGTANPTELLTVNGKILAKEVEVVSSIASDYVFESEYELMPLTDLEIYLKNNKHLPGIPSVNEFKKTGQNLGVMDDLLLRKIEELTLYVIEQDKKIEKLQSELELLKKSE